MNTCNHKRCQTARNGCTHLHTPAHTCTLHFTPLFFFRNFHAMRNFTTIQKWSQSRERGTFIRVFKFPCITALHCATDLEHLYRIYSIPTQDKHQWLLLQFTMLLMTDAKSVRNM